MYDYAFINLELGTQPGRALVLREILPVAGAHLMIKGLRWQVAEARYGAGFRVGIEGSRRVRRR